jgi:membrane-bound lytic murein transglycosylase A
MKHFRMPDLRVLTLFILILGLSACAQIKKLEEETPPLKLEAGRFEDLPGWGRDDMAGALAAFEKSCARILKAPQDRAFGPVLEAGKISVWQGICSDMQRLDRTNENAIQAFLERHFTPYRMLAGDEPEGLFTGYYEASLRGSRTRSAVYNVPLYTRPEDLVMVDLGAFREALKGQRIAGRVVEGNLKPYEDRAAIVAGNWPHNDKVLVWVDDAVDAFFVQIQGSGIVRLDDGTDLRIGYAGQNGHPYYAIGRELIKRGHLTKENVSMQAIREWLAAHPEEADEIMNTNPSYVFFQELTGEGPLGGENVALTAGRSLAIDRSLLPYGMPMWVDIEEPVPGHGRLQRLMVAQDTGGAIRGPVRGDVFWGYGPEAEALAGPMKSKGRYWALLPR